MKKVCIFGAGSYYGNEKLPEGQFLSLAADGGYDMALRLGVLPDIFIGDGDSVQSPVQAAEKIFLKPEKDDTDTLSAVRLAMERGGEIFYFYGCTGGRTAHTLANLQVLSFLAEKGRKGFLLGNHEIFTCIKNDEIQFSSKSEGMISVFSLSEKSEGVSETGLKYTLNQYTMKNTYPIGVSNEFIGKRAKIKVENGSLLVIYTEKAVLEI